MLASYRDNIDDMTKSNLAAVGHIEKFIIFISYTISRVISLMSGPLIFVCGIHFRYCCRNLGEVMIFRLKSHGQGHFVTSIIAYGL